MSFALDASIFPTTPSIELEVEHNEMVASYPSQEPTVQQNFFGVPTSFEVPTIDPYVGFGAQWFDDSCQTNVYNTTNLYDTMPCASAGTSFHYNSMHISSGWNPLPTVMPFALPFPSFATSDVNALPSHTSWHLDMSQASTPSLYNGSSSSSSPILCPSPASGYGSTDFANPLTTHYQHPLMSQQPTIVEPAPVSHQDTQKLFEFLSTMQDIAPVATPFPTPRSKSRSNTKSKRVYKPRPVRPRVECPNCRRGFCRTDALNRHLKNTCGMQCTKCVGKIKSGMACPHHRGTGRPLRGERPAGFVQY